MKAAELRQSILQAAVQGKLVPQNAHDEPASELLKRIWQEKARLIKEGKIKKEKPLPPITEDEIPYDLPDGWIWCRLGTIADHCLGKMLDQQKNIGIKQRYLRNSNVQWFRFDLSDLKEMKIDQSEHERYLVKKGDLIICEGGYPGTSAIWDSDDSIFLQKALHRVRFFMPDMNRFFHYVLYHSSLSGELNQYFTGSGIQHFTGQSLGKFLFPLPPLAEQQRIVAKVDELMALCDELEAAENELNELENRFAADLPKSILQAAVQGKLVPQNVHDEPASELLKSIRQEKARLIKEGKIKKEKPLPPLAVDEIPYDLPDGWVWCRLGDISNYGTCNNVEPSEIPEDAWLLELEDVEKETGAILHRTTKSLRKAQSTKHSFEKDNVLYGKLRPYLNKVLVAPQHGYCSSEILPITFWGNNPHYVATYLRSTLFVDYANQCSYGVKMPRLGTDDGRSATFPLPPIAEQQRIVAKVDDLMALCDELRSVRNLSIKPVVSNLVPFRPKEERDELFIAARGDASQGLSDKAQYDADELLED